MRAVAILGPTASPAAVRPFQIHGIEIAIAEQINIGDPPDAALVFGGDGTIHHQLADLVSTQVPLLPIPMGSGNDFAHALGIRGLADSLRALKQFFGDRRNLHTIDLGVIAETETASVSRNSKPETRSLFCCIAGVGLDSEANRRANAMPRWLRAHGGYAIGVVGALVRFHPQAIRVIADTCGATKRIEAPATMVAIGNAPSYGRGMRIAPRAQLDDGLFDVCFVRRVSRLRLLRFFPRVYSGAHLGMPEIEYVQSARLVLDTDPPLDVYADGEYICRTPVEITVAPRALRVIASVEPRL